MIFIGDIACPSLKVDSFISSIKNLGIFKNEIVVLNLEANILDEKENKKEEVEEEINIDQMSIFEFIGDANG